MNPFIKCSIILYTLLVSPQMLSQINQDIYVSSRNTNSVKVFDGTTGEYKDDFVPPGSGGLSATQEVAFGPDGNLYVSGITSTTRRSK
ncbi:MAG: hypothetical protein JSW63_11685 [Ignavibacterium sp.]|nr:MAG: hypothetical protein JSW63_11685 [Ignavibacterium sp.]